MHELGQATRTILQSMHDRPDELGRLRILLPADRVADEAGLRNLFGNPPGMTFNRVGDQVVVGFQRPAQAPPGDPPVRPAPPGA